MKKNLATRLGVMALVLTLVTSSLVSGTYSKYVQTATGTDSARVAKFAFNLTPSNGTTLSQATSSGIYDVFHYADTGVFGNGLNSGKFIAPGTTGAFTLTVNNLSEVNVNVAFAITNVTTIPVYYTYPGGTVPTQRYSSVLTGAYTGTVPGTYKALTVLSTDMSGAALAASNGTLATTKAYTLNWCWDFNNDAAGGGGDSVDTALGVAGTATDALSIATTVTQSDT